MNEIIGYAIVIEGKYCSTSAPEILRSGTVWQIYKTKEEAEDFLRVPFCDAQYEILPVIISPQ